MASNTEVVHAYRHLYRNLLRAVQYTIPARFVARTQIRAAFREPGAVYDAQGIQRTNWFFEAAAKEKGLEHRILKNLLQVAHRRDYRPDSWRKSVAAGKQKQNQKSRSTLLEHKESAYKHYDMTIAMMNKSLGLLLR